MSVLSDVQKRELADIENEGKTARKTSKPKGGATNTPPAQPNPNGASKDPEVAK
jgi:hypothetical protein